MTCEATLRLAVPDPQTALAALAPDDAGLVDLTIEDGALVVTARSGSPMGLLRTLDDVLACLRAIGE